MSYDKYFETKVNELLETVVIHTVSPSTFKKITSKTLYLTKESLKSLEEKLIPYAITFEKDSIQLYTMRNV